MTIRALIVQMNPIIAAGLRALLEQADFEVIGEVAERENILTFAQNELLDVVILDGDFTSRDQGALELTSQLRTLHPNCHVFVVTLQVNEEACFQFFRHGASAYESITLGSQELVEKVRQVALGEYLIESAPFAHRLATHRTEPEESPVPQQQPRSLLTKRELEVLRLIARGYSNPMIAVALTISDQTIKNHVTSIKKKFGVYDRTSAVVAALLNKLICLDEINPHEIVKKQRRSSSIASPNCVLVNS